MKDKLARRKARQHQQSEAPQQQRRRCSVLQTTQPKPAETNDDARAQASSEKEVQTKAQQLLESQRESVAMLTMVRERIDMLPSTDKIQKVLDRDGYLVIDDFLDQTSVLEQLEKEAETLYHLDAMSANAERGLAMGEYLCPLQGGSEQYTRCPRAIEWVVAVTKHLPDKVSSFMKLENSQCMGRMRLFDQKVLKAAKSLLLSTDDTRASDELSSSHSNQQSFSRVAVEESDLRTLSLCYFLVSKEWDSQKGGGALTFEGTGETVAAVRDRLVVWKSRETSFRQEPWYDYSDADGEDIMLACCIDLHLIQRAV